MAPLNPNNTPRLFVNYNDGQYDHVLLCRFQNGVAETEDAMAAVADYFTAISPYIYEITVTGARVSSQGSDFSFPVTWIGDPSYGDGSMPPVFAPRQLCFLGRSLTGRRFRLFQFAGEFNTPDAYRFGRAENLMVDAVLDSLAISHANGIFVTIDNQIPTMYNYADVNFNNYYEAKVRG